VGAENAVAADRDLSAPYSAARRRLGCVAIFGRPLLNAAIEPMEPRMASKTAKLFFHAEPALREEIERFAESEGRSLSNAMQRIVAEWAARRRADREQQAA
jgi:hypothetical protein